MTESHQDANSDAAATDDDQGKRKNRPSMLLYIASLYVIFGLLGAAVMGLFALGGLGG